MIFSPRHLSIGNRKAREFISLDPEDDKDVFCSASPPPAKTDGPGRPSRSFRPSSDHWVLVVRGCRRGSIGRPGARPCTVGEQCRPRHSAERRYLRGKRDDSGIRRIRRSGHGRAATGRCRSARTLANQPMAVPTPPGCSFIQATDSDMDGLSIGANGLTLNGGTVQDIDRHNAASGSARMPLPTIRPARRMAARTMPRPCAPSF